MTVPDIVRLEEHAANAWPALRTDLAGGWVSRFAGGYSRRANSVHPLYQRQPSDLEARFETAEAAYSAAGLPSQFKILGHQEWTALDRGLERRGYTLEAHSVVLLLDPLPLGAAVPGFSVETKFSDAWYEGFWAANEVSPAHRVLSRSMGALLAKPLAGSVDFQGQTVAWGYAAVDAGWAGIFDVVVDPAFRRRGLGKALMLGLLARARDEGARSASLQVFGDNAPAQALYKELGFKHAYDYWYRRKENP